jgi:hypothetical protein
MFCSLTSLVIPTPKHDEVLNEMARVDHAVRRRRGVSRLVGVFMIALDGAVLEFVRARG